MLINDFVVSLFLVSSEWLIIFAAFSVIVPMIISKGQEINSSKPAKFLIISIFTVTASIVVPRLIGTDLDENGDWLGLVIYAAALGPNSQMINWIFPTWTIWNNVYLIGMFSSIILLIFLGTRKFERHRNWLYTTDPVGDVAQDGFLVTLIGLFAGILPAYFLTLIGQQNLQLSAVLTAMLVYALVTLKLIDKDPSAQPRITKELKSLIKHIRMQHIFTIISFFLYIVPGVAILSLTNWKTHVFIKELWDKYIPKIEEKE